MSRRSAPPVSFSRQIRDATWQAHQRVAGAPFLAALVAGRLPQAAYTALVVEHSWIYDRLEALTDSMSADPVAGAFAFPELRRGPSLERDLEALLGPDHGPTSGPLAATRRYCDRMSEVASDWPGGLVAHHYTRYLGDLSGGAVMASAVASTYGLGPTHGAAFYEFPAISDVVAFKAEYRRRLDRAPWDDDERARIVAEVVAAHHHNENVLSGLAVRFADG